MREPGNTREPEERLRRGPIVDPKRRPAPDEQPVGRPPRPGRPGAATGTISKISRDFGFIRDGAGRTRFFHRTAVAGAFESLREGQTVQFEPQDLPKGLRALNVRPVGGGPSGGQGRPGPRRAEQPYGRGGQGERGTSYGRGTATGGPPSRGQGQYGQRRSTAGGGTAGGARRGPDGRPQSTSTGWRSSLSPFRGDPPPSRPPRRGR